MRRYPKYARLAIWLLGVAFALRLVAGYWWQARLPDGQRFAFGDSESYWVLAQTIVRGQPYQYGEQLQVFRTPGYPVLLAGLFALVGDDPPVLWARALGAVCGTLAVGGVIALTWLLFDARSALLAGALAGLYPGAISLSVFVLSEAPFCPLLLLQLICWVVSVGVGSERRSIVAAAFGGLAAGLATLMRPSWLLFTPGAAVLEILVCRGSRRHARVGATMTAVLALTLLPWWIRNYEVTGRWVPTTLQVGASLYDGLSPTANGASDMRFVEKFYAGAAHRGGEPTRRVARDVRIPARSADARGGDRVGRAAPRQRPQADGSETAADVESLAQRGRHAELDVPRGGGVDLHALGRLRCVGRLRFLAPRLALLAVPAPGRLFHLSARGVCQFDSLSRASHAALDCAGRRPAG